MTEQIIIEVGANIGKDTQGFLSSFPNPVIYSFEPTRELVAGVLWPKFGSDCKVRIIPFAIDVVNAFKEFKIAGQADWGCSSLYDFDEEIHNKWTGRPDFKKTHSYPVPTITLYDFCTLYSITTIDYLHIDAQGNDFNCLLSLKDKISIVKRGVCEVAYNCDLYSGTNNQYNTVKPWLEEHGFRIVKESSNDTFSMEKNLYFERIA